MLIFLIFLFFIIIALMVFRGIFFTVLNVVASTIDRIFHRKGKRDASDRTTGKTRIHTRPAQKNGKIFDSSDGEYVDYEEVK